MQMELKKKYFPDIRFTELTTEQIKHISSEEMTRKILLWLPNLTIESKAKVFNAVKSVVIQ